MDKVSFIAPPSSMKSSIFKLQGELLLDAEASVAPLAPRQIRPGTVVAVDG
jgi:hypothetical protein